MSAPVLTAAGEVRVSGHAVDRYVERVKPAHTPKHAHWELARILPLAVAVEAIPVWADRSSDRGERYATDCYLVLCDSLVFPVFGGVVLTCMVRGSVGPVARLVRKGERQQHRRHIRERAQDKRNKDRSRRKLRAQGRDIGDAPREGEAA